jgi:hypothetical protein
MQKTILSKYHWLEGSLDLKAEFLRLLSKAEYAEFLAKNGLALSRVVVSPQPLFRWRLAVSVPRSIDLLVVFGDTPDKTIEAALLEICKWRLKGA